MCLVDKLVVRGRDAALVDAEEVLLGDIWVKKTKTKELRDLEEKVAYQKSKVCIEFRRQTKKQKCHYFFLFLKGLPGLS